MRLAALCLLAGCAAAPAAQEAAAPPAVPAELRACPVGHRPPAVPPRPRTVDQVADWANGVLLAWQKTEDARTECARRLNRLVEWVETR